jgi:hypothetical protein
MTTQWKDELEAKFGLSFEIIDRERVGEIRRLRGFSVNPWTTGSRFIISHRLLTDEVYAAGLRGVLGEFRARALFILDEAHHAAPSAGTRYAVSSQLTKAVRELAERFEHRLFLTATPHNGHSNSFSALLEMLDPQRFTRGVEIRAGDLEPVMVRRLKADLRRLGEAFPERIVEAVRITDLPKDAPELELARRLAAYGELRMKRIAGMPSQKASMAKLAFVGLQQRLLSSIAAFARTLKVHRATLKRVLDGEEASRVAAAAQAFVDGPVSEDCAELGLEDDSAERAIDADDDAIAEAASALGVAGAAKGDLGTELAVVDEMLTLAERHATRPECAGGLAGGLDQSELACRGGVEPPAPHHLYALGSSGLARPGRRSEHRHADRMIPIRARRITSFRSISATARIRRSQNWSAYNLSWTG